MASSQNKDEKDEILQNELEKKLDEDEEKLLEKKQEIDTLTNSFGKESENLIDEIDEIETETDNELDVANNLLDATRTQAENFIELSRTFVGDIQTSLENFSRSIKIMLTVLFGGMMSLFIGLYFLIPYLQSEWNINYSIDPVLISGTITIISFVALAVKISRSIDSKVFDFSTKRNHSLSQLESNTTPFTKNKIKVTSKKEKVSNKLHQIGTNLNKIVVGTQGYIPGLKEHFSGLALLNRQQHFALTMLNALDDYGLLDDSIEEKLRAYSNLKHNEEEWLYDASQEISKITGVSIEILQLCYYDYEGNKSKTENSWRAVQTNNKVEELIEILKKNLFPVSQTHVVNQPFIELISQVTPFSLSKFMRLYNDFYNEFDKEKKLLLQALQELGFSISSEQRLLVNNLFPKSTNTNEWSEHMINATAKILQKYPLTILLLYTDKIGEVGKRDTYWNKSREDSQLLEDLSEFIVKRNVFPDEFQKEDLKKLCRTIISDRSNLDINEVTKDAWDRIYEIQRTKKLFDFALEAKKIPVLVKLRENFKRIIAFGDDIDKEIAQKLGTMLEIDSDFILLFYFDYAKIPNQRRSKFDEIRRGKPNNPSKLRELASLLLEDGLVKKETKYDEDMQLSFVLQYMDDFDLDEIRSYYSFFHKVFLDAKDFIELLDREQIVNNGNLDFDKIIEILQNDNISRYEALKKISFKIISQDQRLNLDQKTKLEHEQFESLIVSLLAIHFKGYFDTARDDACRDASTRPYAARLLYEWVSRKDEEKELAKHESSFHDILQPIFDESIKSFEHIDDFIRTLEDGKLVGSIRALLSARLGIVNTKLDKISGERYVSVLTKVGGNLNEVLKLQITEGFITQALKSQLISAYMITYKEGPVIKVIENHLNDASDELSKTDPLYKNLIIMKAHDSEAGRGTRVGVVPLHIKDFQEFNKLFQNAFDVATKKLSAVEPKYKNSPFFANLIRVIPSPLAFKHIQSNSKTTADPVNTIIDLVKTELGPIDRIKLATLEKGSESPSTALQEILESIFNNTKPTSFVSDDAKNILSQNPKLVKTLSDKAFIDEIYDLYGVSTNTNLAEKIYLENLQNPTETFSKFTSIMISTLKKHDIRLSELDLMKLSKSFFDNLINVAKFLRGTL